MHRIRSCGYGQNSTTVPHLFLFKGRGGEGEKGVLVCYDPITSCKQQTFLHSNEMIMPSNSLLHCAIQQYSSIGKWNKTEVWMEIPNNTYAQNLTCSSYKGCNTFRPKGSDCHSLKHEMFEILDKITVNGLLMKWHVNQLRIDNSHWHCINSCDR